jgi:hypothetical protein
VDASSELLGSKQAMSLHPAHNMYAENDAGFVAFYTSKLHKGLFIRVLHLSY